MIHHMNMKGLTLIEVIIFMVITAIVLPTFVTLYSNIIQNNITISSDFTAAQLAQARMNLLLQQRIVHGFSSINDPCSSNAPAACIDLTNFADNNGFSIQTTLTPASNGIITATVTVSGSGSATSIMRFVE